KNGSRYREGREPLDKHPHVNSHGNQAASSARATGSREADARVIRPVVSTAGSLRLALGKAEASLANAGNGLTIDGRATGGAFAFFTDLHNTIAALRRNRLASGITDRRIWRLALLGESDDSVAAAQVLAGRTASCAVGRIALLTRVNVSIPAV